MARIKVETPEKFIFKTDLEIRISEINYGGHLGNDSVLALVHESRLRFLKSHGYNEMDIDGVSLIMIDAGIEFKSETFHGDRIRIEIATQDISKIGFDLIYKLTNLETARVMAFVKTGMVFFDYNNHKMTSAPQGFLEKFGGI